MEIAPIINFLTKLKDNNNKEWFDAHKKEYQSLREQWILLAEELINALAPFEPAIGGLEPKKCIFRINRDIRFSKDKSPYKTNFGINLNLLPEKQNFCGFYLHVEPNNTFVAGGMYLPQPTHLSAVRQEIDYNLDEFKKIVESKIFIKRFESLGGEMLTRPPKGYDADNPAIEFIKHKNFLAQQDLNDFVPLGDTFKNEVVNSFKDMLPLVWFLLRSVSR